MTKAVIGRYEVIERLGQGGMGSLYLARDPVIDRLVAIKLLREGIDTQDLRERFAREARSAGRLRHPNIVTIFDVGEHDGQPFIAMEYIPGQTLGELIHGGGTLTLERKLRLMEDLCGGLGYAHAAGIVHRDVKPANVMVDPDGTLKILDFGIARVGESSMTQAGMIVGTLNYMSPEQVAGGAVDHRSDVFAVGAVFYELLCGRQAFPGSLQNGILHRILQLPPQPLPELIPGIDAAIVRIVDTALEKDPTRRYQDLGAMRRDIAQVRRRLPVAAAQLAGDPGETIELRPETPAAKTPRRGTDPDVLARRRAIEVERHLEAARQAFEAGDYATAIAACENALLLDPDRAAAADLLDRARASAARAEAAAAIERARADLERGNLTAASVAVEDAVRLDPESADVPPVRRAIEEARTARERAARADALADQAIARLREQAPESAIRLAEEALALDPAHAGARQAIERAETAIETRRREEHDRRAAESVRDARARFANGDREAALDLLRAFTPAHPAVSQALGVLEGEAKAIERRERQAAEARRRAEAERAARERRMAAALDAARAAVGEGRFDAAIRSLDEARRIDDAHADIAPLLERAQAGRRAREEERERKRHLDAALDGASRALAAGDFTAARQGVEQAIAIDAGEARALALKSRLEHAIEEDARRRREIAGLVAEASRLEAAHDLSGALDRADAALALDSADAAARQLRGRVAAAIEAERARRRKVDDAIAKARTARSHATAIERLRAALALDAGNEQAQALLREREASLEREVAAQRRAEETEQLAASARRALKRRDWEAARTAQDRLVEIDAGHPAVAAVRDAFDRRARQAARHLARPAGRASVLRNPRVAGGLALAAAALLAVAALVLLPARGRHPATPTAGAAAARRSIEKPVPLPAAPETARPAPTSGAAEAPSAETDRPRDENGQRAARLGREARKQMENGDWQTALASVRSGLQLQQDDRELQAVLGDLLREAERHASQARAQARRAGAAAQPAFAGAARTMESAAAVRRSRPEEAVRLFWSASDQFGQAEDSTRQAAAQPPAQKPTAAAPGQAQPSQRPDVARGVAQGPERQQPAPPALPPVSPAPSNPGGSTQQPVEPPAARPGPATPPPSAPARPSPSAPSAPSTADEAARIQRALEAYKAAYESLDANAVRNVQPSLTGQEAERLEKAFADLRSYRVEIDDVRITINGSQAEASCRITRRYDPKAGKPGGNTTSTVFHLQKRGGAWVIAGVEAR